MTEEIYIPIFFQKEWISEKYHDWFCVHEERGVRIIRKRFGLFQKTLFLCQGVDDERLAVLISDCRFSEPLAIDIVHDFSRPPEVNGIELAGCRFEYVPDKQRILNIGTFIIDLAEAEDKLWAKLDSNTRTKTRKAQKVGVRSRVSNNIRDPDIEAFFSLYAAMAKRVGLDTLDRAVIEKMIERGDLIGVSAIGPDGVVSTVNLVYLCRPYAFDVYGASGENIVTGAGQFVRWEMIRLLKGLGLRWYDFGGVSSTDPSNSIYAFKKSFGGKYIELGSEYRRVSPTLTAYKGLRQAKQLFATVTKKLQG
jgi:hypothetical protein